MTGGVSGRRHEPYQKKNLEKKLASSTGDFCILSAAPVCSLLHLSRLECASLTFACPPPPRPEWLPPHGQENNNNFKNIKYFEAVCLGFGHRTFKGERIYIYIYI